MATIKETVDTEGRVSLKKILSGTNIKPGDLVEVVAEKNKIVLKIKHIDKSKKVFSRMAGIWAGRQDCELDDIMDRSDREVADFD